MTKQLTLKPRNLQSGNYAWHDLFVMQQALDSITRGRPISKIALEMGIAAKLQYEMEKCNLVQNLSESTAVDITIELRNVAAKVLVRELKKLKPEDYGRNQMGQPMVPPLGLLSQMLTDVVEQLGYKMPMPDEEDDEDEEDE